MTTRCSTWGLLVVTTVAGWGCSDDKSTGSGSRPGTTEEYPPVQLPSTCEVPASPAVAGTSRVVGDGTAASCTNEALQSAATRGGIITFDCGPDSIVIRITKTVTVETDAMLDGAGRITLDGGGQTRILMASNEVVLAVRGLSFTRGSAVGEADLPSGGAIRGGLRVGNAQLDLGQSLFVRNHSDGHGGGLWGDGNWAVNSAGAIFNEDTTSSLTNSLVVRSRADNEWGIKLACRSPMAGGRNLQWPDPGSDVRCTAETTIADPLLGTLTDNGGATNTEALGVGSSALDAATQCPAIDQRGELRAEPCDLGAYER